MKTLPKDLKFLVHTVHRTVWHQC